MNALTPLRHGPPLTFPHASWSRARAALIERAKLGGTTALLGEPGTGKTWLLRQLAREFEACGWQVQFVRQGDMAWRLAPRTLLLIDEASRIDPAALAMIATQRISPVMLAGLPGFATRLREFGIPTVTIDRLSPAETIAFGRRWLTHAGPNALPMTERALTRLAAAADGTPRLAIQLLNASAAMVASGSGALIDGADIDEAAALRLGGLAPDAAPVAVSLPRRRRSWRKLLRPGRVAAASAIAAGVVLALAALSPPSPISTYLRVSNLISAALPG